MLGPGGPSPGILAWGVTSAIPAWAALASEGNLIPGTALTPAFFQTYYHPLGGGAYKAASGKQGPHPPKMQEVTLSALGSLPRTWASGGSGWTSLLGIIP